MPTLYLHINSLPLNKFIEVATTGNLSALTITGFPSQEELFKSWGKILEQYSEAIGNHEQLLYLSLYKEINQLNATIQQIEIIVSMLSKVYSGALVSRLNSLLGTNMFFDVKQPEEYDKTLQRCINRSKGLKINLDLKLSAFQAIEAKQKDKSGAVTKEYFQSVLVVLRRADSIFYEAEKITVFEYCTMIKDMQKRQEEAKNQKR